eukprot:GHRR01026537.1.p1 GENE.GHRR01026537.1~~GHRR01026537.1.p1  ORF type:complete len:683 (+),score=323.94 GHRR01026537.1:88-2136(+)
MIPATPKYYTSAVYLRTQAVWSAVLSPCRAVKVHDRRVRKARAKQNMSLARRLLANKPGYKLDHLVKERYPSFIDALRDLDDPLTLVHLFATLPGEATYGISPAAVDRCRRLVLEWNAYVARTHSLRKVFVSVKGFYYQAEVAGCLVTWLVPHQLGQVLPRDVDYTVMLTFLEFYCTLLQFVMFKLYHNLGLRYPPVVDRRLEEAVAGLAGIMKDIAGLQQDATSQQQQIEGRQDPSAATDAADAAAAAVVPDIVQRLGTLGKEIQQLRQQQQNGGQQSDKESDGSDMAVIDSGDGLQASENEDSNYGSESESAKGKDEQSGSDHGQSGDEENKDSEAAAGEVVDMQLAEGDPTATAERKAAGVNTDTNTAAAAGGGLGEVDPDDDAGVCSVLLKGCTLYLAREVPREPLLFIVRAFGGVAGWDGEGSPFTESDESITHQVVDRPTQGHRFLSRVYVQPQWVFDSVNHRVLMPAELYAPGIVPPPHLSPFVDNEAEGYTPEFALKIKQLQDAAREARRAAAGQATDAAFLQDTDGQQQQQQQQPVSAGAGQDEAAAETTYRCELAKELKVSQQQQQGVSASETDDERSEGGEESEDAAAAAAGFSKGNGAHEPKVPEAEQLADIMMTRKNRKLYARINRAVEGKAERVLVLEKRKRVLETGSAEGRQQQQQPSSRQRKGKAQ